MVSVLQFPFCFSLPSLPSQLMLDLKCWSLWNVWLVLFLLPFSCTSGEGFCWGWREGGWGGWFWGKVYFLFKFWQASFRAKPGELKPLALIIWISDSWLNFSYLRMLVLFVFFPQTWLKLLLKWSLDTTMMWYWTSYYFLQRF